MSNEFISIVHPLLDFSISSQEITCLKVLNLLFKKYLISCSILCKFGLVMIMIGLSNGNALIKKGAAYTLHNEPPEKSYISKELVV